MSKVNVIANRFVMLVMLAGALVVWGCGPSRRAADTPENQGVSEGKVMTLTMLVMAHRDQHGQWPESLEEVREHDPDFEELMWNPVTGAEPGYEYVKPVATNPLGGTIMIYQLRDGQRDESLPAGYSNGLVDKPGGLAALDAELKELDNLDFNPDDFKVDP